jgi:peptidyl-prolyl cis-trans isomerase D
MLDIFRQKGLSNAIYGLIIVATILVFVLQFRPSAQQKTASLSQACAARVRGRCIEPKDFAAAYRMLAPSRSSSVSRKLNLKKVALDGLIERELLDDEAKRLGIAVTDKEVTDELYSGYVRVSVPAADPHVAQSIITEMYQGYVRMGLVPQDLAQAQLGEHDTAIPVDFHDPKTKTFDMKVYERKVRDLSNRSTAEFREEQARELLAAKMRDAVRGPVRISEAEAWEDYERRFSTATLTHIPVKESWAARWTVDPKDAGVEAWRKEHQAEVDKVFEERKKEDAPKAGHVRHILVKLPYGATEDEKAAAVAKLSWAVARVKAGESFAEVARQISEDTGSAMKGGDVGDKTDPFVPPFRAAADALRPGEMTAGAVETQFGYHFLAKDDPAKASEVEAQVRRSVEWDIVSKAKALENAQVVAKKIEESMRAGKNPQDAIKDAILSYVRQDKASKVEMLRVLPPHPGALGDAGGGGVGDGGAPAQKPLPAATFDASTDSDRPQTQTSNAYNRGGDPFPGVTPEGQAALITFSFSAKDGDVMDTPLRTPQGYEVVVLKQHKQATREEYEKDRESFERDLLAAKRDEALGLYVKRLRDQAKDDVKIDESYIREASVDGGTAPDEEDEY